MIQGKCYQLLAEILIDRRAVGSTEYQPYKVMNLASCCYSYSIEFMKAVGVPQYYLLVYTSLADLAGISRHYKLQEYSAVALLQSEN